MPETHSVSIAGRNGPLAQIWLAANMSNLARGQVLQTSISKSADEIAKVSGCEEGLSNMEHITLRTSGELLQGIVRVYSKQAAFLLSDIKDTLTKISTLFKSNQRTNMAVNKSNTIATVEQLILEDAVTEKEVLMAPGLEFLEESAISEGLMGQAVTADKNQRKVQGAAPWDTSIEFGRRFDPDDDLGNNQSSGIDLDFEIDDEQLSRTIGEGTRQTLSHDEGGRGSQALDSQDHLIEDDDFPPEDPNSIDWDLGITENREQDRNSDAGSHDSVEIGRRAEERSVTEEPIDFGFNLDIEKDFGEEQQQEEQEQEQEQQSKKQSQTTPVKPKKHPELRNCKKIEQDIDTELDDHNQKDALMRSQLQTTTEEISKPPRLTQKRLWEEMAHSLAYLPQEAMERLLPLRMLKRQKPELEEQSEDSNEPHLDISLGLNDDLLSESSLGDRLPPSEPGDNDYDMPVDRDIGDRSSDEDRDAVDENNMLRQSIEQGLDSGEQAAQASALSDSQKVQLNTGEFVSKDAVDFAELLRTEFIDHSSLLFDNLLVARNRTRQNAKNAPIERQEAAGMFFDVLSLATSDCIDLDQKDFYGDISITARPSLYERFIPA